MDIVLISHGAAAAVIVIPAPAPPPVAFAASELQAFLKRMSGATLPIAHAVPDTGTAIVLGRQLAEGCGIAVAGVKRDGFVIETQGQRLFIAGEDDDTARSAVLQREDEDWPGYADPPTWDFERGTLHGVYYFLESLGVRWFFPGPKGEVVPACTTVSTGTMHRREEPYFELRDSWSSTGGWPVPADPAPTYYDRDEMIALDWSWRNQRWWLLRQRVSSRVMAFNHSSPRHDWHARFAATHPEYFALKPDGTRAVGTHSDEDAYLNYTEEGVFRETLADIDAFFTGKPASARGIRMHPTGRNGWHPGASSGDTFSLLPNDGIVVDQSAKSRPYIRETAPFYEQHSDYVWQFVDKVARAVAPRHPGKYLTCLAYQTYAEVPRREVVPELPDNVIVGIAALSGCSVLTTSLQETLYARHLDRLGRWSKMNHTPMLFWNYDFSGGGCRGGACEGIPMLLPHHMARFLRDQARFGRYAIFQNDFDNIAFTHINRYVSLRCMWNPWADVDAIMADYCLAFFGPAAAVMQTFLTDIEAICMRIGQTRADPVSAWSQHFTGEKLACYRRWVDEAIRLAATTPFAGPVEFFSRRFVGAMESARPRFAGILSLRDRGADILRIPRKRDASAAAASQDAAPAWAQLPRSPLFSVTDGQGAADATHVQLCWDEVNLHCRFVIHSPGLKQRLERRAARGDAYYVEILVEGDPEVGDYYSFYVNVSGHVIDRSFPAPGQPADNNRQSGLQAQASIRDDGWEALLTIPLRGVHMTPETGPHRRAIFCIGLYPEFDRVGNGQLTSSPIMRGGWHNPSLFNRLEFA